MKFFFGFIIKNKRVIQFLISTLIIAYIFSSIDLKQLWQTVKSIKLFWFSLAWLIMWISPFIVSYKWWKILRFQGFNLTYLYIVKVNWVGSFYNQFFPSRVGGDAIKILYLIRTEKDQKLKSSMSVIIDRFYNVLGLLIISYYAVLINISQNQIYIFPLLAMTAIILLVFLFILFGERIILYFKLGQYSIFQKINQLSIAMKLYINSFQKNSFMLLWALIFDMSTIIVVFLMAKSLGINADFTYFLFFVPVVFIVTILPISIGGIGVREVSYIFFLTAIGVKDEVSISLSLLLYISMIIKAIPGYFLQFGNTIQSEKN